jgi:hypothetical protein
MAIVGLALNIQIRITIAWRPSVRLIRIGGAGR